MRIKRKTWRQSGVADSYRFNYRELTARSERVCVEVQYGARLHVLHPWSVKVPLATRAHRWRDHRLSTLYACRTHQASSGRIGWTVCCVRDVNASVRQEGFPVFRSIPSSIQYDHSSVSIHVRRGEFSLITPKCCPRILRRQNATLDARLENYCRQEWLQTT